MECMDFSLQEKLNPLCILISFSYKYLWEKLSTAPQSKPINKRKRSGLVPLQGQLKTPTNGRILYFIVETF